MSDMNEEQAKAFSEYEARKPQVEGELPLVRSQAELHRVHRTSGLYFVKRGGTAHAAMDCDHLDASDLVGNPTWRVATTAQCRGLGIPWCSDCS